MFTYYTPKGYLKQVIRVGFSLDSNEGLQLQNMLSILLDNQYRIKFDSDSKLIEIYTHWFIIHLESVCGINFKDCMNTLTKMCAKI